MSVDRAVGRHRREVVQAAVVLVEEAGLAVVHDERRVAAGAVGEGGLDVDLDRQTTEIDGRAVLGAHEFAEAERPQLLLEFVGRIAGEQHGGRAVDVLGEVGDVEVVAVQMGDVQIVRMFDGVADALGQMVVPGEHEPRAEEGGHEPRIANDRAVTGLHEDAGVADRRCAHRESHRWPRTGQRSKRIRRRGGRCTAGPRARRTRSTAGRPSSASRSDRTDPDTTRPGS